MSTIIKSYIYYSVYFSYFGFILNFIMQIKHSFRFGLFTIGSTFLIAKELFSKNSAFLSVIIVGINFYFIKWTKELNADIPSLAFALLSIYAAIRYNKTEKIKWVIISSFLFSITNTFKLLELFFAFPIAYLLIFRPLDIHESSLKKVSF